MLKTRILSVTLGIICLFMLLFGSSRFAQSQIAATTVATVQVASTMDAAPVNCGSLPQPFRLSTGLNDVIGAWPMWVGVSAGDLGRESVIDMPKITYVDPEPALKGWWGTKIGWLVDVTYKGKVSLRGYNVADNSPIYFHVHENEPATPLVILDPTNPGGFIAELKKWAFFPSYIWVSKAGCYTIEATWEGGLWRQVISIGNVLA
jgi:hypothetical protein